MTTRRGFLASILAAGVAPAAIGSNVLMPIKTIWTPVNSLQTGNTLLTPQMIAKEALQILHKEFRFSCVNKPYQYVDWGSQKLEQDLDNLLGKSAHFS